MIQFTHNTYTHSHTHSLRHSTLTYFRMLFVHFKLAKRVEYEILQIVDKQENMIDFFSTRGFNIL